jgi:hypothetical protein
MHVRVQFLASLESKQTGVKAMPRLCHLSLHSLKPLGTGHAISADVDHRKPSVQLIKHLLDLPHVDYSLIDR